MHKIAKATTVVLAVESDTSVEFVTVDATQLSSSHGDGLDPALSIEPGDRFDLVPGIENKP